MTQMLTTKERAFAGAIITTINLDTREQEVTHVKGYHWENLTKPEKTRDGYPAFSNRTRVFHRYGVRDAVKEFCRNLEQQEGDWRIQSISTPQTILNDLQGREPGGINRSALPPNPDLDFLAKAGYAHLHVDA